MQVYWRVPTCESWGESYLAALRNEEFSLSYPVPVPPQPGMLQLFDAAFWRYFALVYKADATIAELRKRIRTTVEAAAIADLQAKLAALLASQNQCNATWNPILKNEETSTTSSSKPVNLPSAKTIKIDMEEVVSGHNKDGSA